MLDLLIIINPSTEMTFTYSKRFSKALLCIHLVKFAYVGCISYLCQQRTVMRLVCFTKFCFLQLRIMAFQISKSFRVKPFMSMLGASVKRLLKTSSISYIVFIHLLIPYRTRVMFTGLEISNFYTQRLFFNHLYSALLADSANLSWWSHTQIW